MLGEPYVLTISKTFFACTQLGAALVLLNYAYAESEMLALLNRVRKSIPKLSDPIKR